MTEPSTELETTRAATVLTGGDEALTLHREPLEGPDTVSPLRAPDDVPPPPPFEDSPERPLFAPTARRVPANARPAAAAPEATGGGAAATGGGGSQEFWPFVQDLPSEPAGDGHEGRGWLRTAVVVALLLATVVAMAAAFSLGRGGGLPIVGGSPEDPTASSAPRSQSVPVSTATDFDPQGDGAESPELAGNAVDGDPSTSWSTVTYYNRPDLGGLKDGVGLMLDLGGAQQVREVTVRFASSPTSFEVYAAARDASGVPGDVGQMQLVGGQDDAPERATVRLDPVPTTRYLLVWLTNLPSAPGGYRGEIAEVGLRS